LNPVTGSTGIVLPSSVFFSGSIGYISPSIFVASGSLVVSTTIAGHGIVASPNWTGASAVTCVYGSSFFQAIRIA
jgi:hypothetical protein